MLLAIDIGNTNIVLGIYEGRKLVTHCRLLTVPERTADEYGVLISPLAAANGIGAYERYHDCCIAVDFGTATTFDFISKKGEYVGGAIAPGLQISVEALFQRASKLPRVEIVKPKDIIGKTPVQSIQSGVFYGYVGLVDGIVARMQKENR